MGSGDIASKAMTATSGQSDSPSARTDQLRDGNPSPKQPRETLADQASKDNIADANEDGLSMKAWLDGCQTIVDRSESPPQKAKFLLFSQANPV